MNWKKLVGLTMLCCSVIAGMASPGAVWTTVSDGTVVNGNIYAANTDVFISGGPGAHAKCDAAGLPDGVWYFKVTNPSGSLLLSTDSVSERAFRVVGGKITEYLGTTHLTNVNPCGGLTIQLMPYSRTDNNGGEYKAWVSQDPAFSKSENKTDNYKIRTDVNCLSKSVKVCLSCPLDIVIPCDEVNGTGAIVNYTLPVVLPEGTPMTCTPPSGSFFPVGTTVVRVVAINAKGQSAVCQFNVTVGDCPRFDLVCPGNIDACATGSGVCTATGLFTVPAGDSRVTVVSSHAPDANYALGTTVVTFTATQGERLVQTCSFNVNVRDCSQGVICGNVFYDMNADGSKLGDSPIAGWRLVLSGSVNWTGYTDSTGAYCFSGLPAGTYTLTQSPPPGCWVSTTATSRTFTVSCENISNVFSTDFGNVCRCPVSY